MRTLSPRQALAGGAQALCWAALLLSGLAGGGLLAALARYLVGG